MEKLESTSTTIHPLQLLEGCIASNLNEYTEGDTDFLIEFAQNIRDNISHLRSELSADIFSKSSAELAELTHMVKPTIEIIGVHGILDSLMKLRSESLSKSEFESLIKAIDETIATLKNIIERATKRSLIQH